MVHLYSFKTKFFRPHPPLFISCFACLVYPTFWFPMTFYITFNRLEDGPQEGLCGGFFYLMSWTCLTSFGYFVLSKEGEGAHPVIGFIAFLAWMAFS